MKRIYLAAPVRPIEGETKEGNLGMAKLFYQALAEVYTEFLILAPWILNCECFPEEPEYIEIGMKRNHEVIKLCDELWLCGPRVSTGMLYEAAIFIAEKKSPRKPEPTIFRIEEVPEPQMYPVFERWDPNG